MGSDQEGPEGNSGVFSTLRENLRGTITTIFFGGYCFTARGPLRRLGHLQGTVPGTRRYILRGGVKIEKFFNSSPRPVAQKKKKMAMGKLVTNDGTSSARNLDSKEETETISRGYTLREEQGD